MPEIDFHAHGINTTSIRGGKGFCPRCTQTRKNKRDRSLSVDLHRGIWNCHNCGWKGSAVIRPEYERPKKVYARPKPRPAQVSSKVVEWFKSRGISQETLTKAGVTEGVQWMPQVGAERNAICFNYFRDGELINIKYRDAEKNFRMEKDAELIFYNLDSLKGATGCIIVEGEIDALSIIEAGVKVPVLSVPNGASKGNQRLEYLDNCWDCFEQCTEIILATDNDEAGRMLQEELARRLGKIRCMTLTFPDGLKDANEVLQQSGKAGVIELLKTAQWFPLEGVESPADHYDEALGMFQNGYPKGVRAGLGEFDDLLTFDPAGFTVITGIPGHGKSTFLNNLLLAFAKNHDWRIGMFSPEMMPYALLTNILIEILTNKGLRRDMTIDEYNAAYSFISDHFYYLKMDEMDITLDGILEKAEELVKLYGINALVIDPFNYVEHQRANGQSETDYISEALTKVKRFKSRCTCHVFMVVHPTKIPLETGKSQYRAPKLYDISGSAHWYNKMDNGIVVYKDIEQGITEIQVQKVRWFFLGKEGTCSMLFDKTTKRFTPQQSEAHEYSQTWKPYNEN